MALTEQFFRPSRNMKLDSLMQALRIVGYTNNSSWPKNVYMEEKDITDVIRQYNLTMDCVEKLENDFMRKDFDESYSTSMEIMSDMRVCSVKIPKRNLCSGPKGNLRTTVRVVKGDKDDLRTTGKEFVKQIAIKLEAVKGETDNTTTKRGDKINKFVKSTKVGNLYTHEQIISIIEKSGYLQPSSMLYSFQNNKSDAKFANNYLLKQNKDGLYERVFNKKYD